MTHKISRSSAAFFSFLLLRPAYANSKLSQPAQGKVGKVLTLGLGRSSLSSKIGTNKNLRSGALPSHANPFNTHCNAKNGLLVLLIKVFIANFSLLL
jgi:hypothetical protein